jgi:hypothetical protein
VSESWATRVCCVMGAHGWKHWLAHVVRFRFEKPYKYHSSFHVTNAVLNDYSWLAEGMNCPNDRKHMLGSVAHVLVLMDQPSSSKLRTPLPWMRAMPVRQPPQLGRVSRVTCMSSLEWRSYKWQRYNAYLQQLRAFHRDVSYFSMGAAFSSDIEDPLPSSPSPPLPYKCIEPNSACDFVTVSDSIHNISELDLNLLLALEWMLAGVVAVPAKAVIDWGDSWTSMIAFTGWACQFYYPKSCNFDAPLR